MPRAALCFDFSSTFGFDVFISDGPEQYYGFWWEMLEGWSGDGILDEKSEFNMFSLGVLYRGAWLHTPSAVTAMCNHTC